MAFNPRTYSRQWMAARRDRWQALGLCGGCGVPVVKFRWCTRCRRVRAKASLRAYYRRKRAA